MQRLEADWRTRMRSAVDAETRSWCRLEEYVTVGRPGEVIVRTANELGSEIIVMGVQRRGALDLMMFGSTAHRVVREAPCPVMTIRANA
jgi:nucleotide-binding universal stress UspA family protein